MPEHLQNVLIISCAAYCLGSAVIVSAIAVHFHRRISVIEANPFVMSMRRLNERTP